MSHDISENARKMDEALELLREGEFDQALEMGRALAEDGYTGGFEVVAHALRAQGHVESAIDVLKQAVELAPDVWRFWVMLGDFHCDSDRYEEGHVAYTRARECPRADIGFISGNQAAAYFDQRRLEDALPFAEESIRLDGNPFMPAMLVKGLWQLGRVDEAVERGQALLATLKDEHPGKFRLHTELAVVHWVARQDQERASAHAHAAVCLKRGESTALRVIREAHARTSPRARWYQLDVEGDWVERTEEGHPMGFTARYGVVAESPEQALQFCLPFEPEGTHASLHIHKVMEGQPTPDGLLGVHGMTGRITFPKDSETM